MKLKTTIFFSALILLFSCQRDDKETQSVDQILKLYMKNSAGQDLLNSKLQGSYTSASLLDLLGEKDLQAISGYTFPKDADTVVYMDYPAGAIRLKIDSLSNDEQQIYYSQFVIKLLKKDEVLPDYDTIKIEYKSTPSLFQISKLWYNDVLKFTKISGQPNIVTIVK